MVNHPSNVNFWDDLAKWLELPAHDEPLGGLTTNGGDSGSTEKLTNACQPNPETESECMAICVVGEIGLLGDRWRRTLTVTRTCRHFHDRW